MAMACSCQPSRGVRTAGKRASFVALLKDFTNRGREEPISAEQLTQAAFRILSGTLPTPTRKTANFVRFLITITSGRARRGIHPPALSLRGSAKAVSNPTPDCCAFAQPRPFRNDLERVATSGGP